MLLFAHTGITLGAATIIAGAVKKRHTAINERFSWLASLSSYIDIRILLIGSMLPDIIDKPLGIYILGDTLCSGRIYSHTLLFFILITAGGFTLYKLKSQTWLLVLAAGTLAHLILDQMWASAKTLFWPLLGLEFERTVPAEWFANLWKALQTHPWVYIPEMVGFVILIWFGVLLFRRRQIIDFIRYGKAG